MMNQSPILQEISLCLQAEGLEVVAPLPGSMAMYAERSVLHREWIDSGIRTFAEMGYIRFQQDHWGFEASYACPGPGPEDVEQWFATPEKLCTFILHFFLSEPRCIAGWIVPIHRHPEWPLSELTPLMARAPAISTAVWSHIYQQADEASDHLHDICRAAQTTRAVAWAQWLDCQFVPLEPEAGETGEILWVRRNLQDAFRVRIQCPTCHHEHVVRTEWSDFSRAKARYGCLTCGQVMLYPGPRTTSKATTDYGVKKDSVY